MKGQELAELRKMAGLSQGDLAVMLAVHPKTIANWESKRGEEIATRENRGAIIETVAHTLRQIAALQGTDFADPDQAMPSPYQLEDIINSGDLLLLSDREAAAGDLIVTFSINGKPERLGRAYSAEGGGLVIIDHADQVCKLPERVAYRVIAHHVRTYGAAADGGQ